MYEQGCWINDLDKTDVYLPIQATHTHKEVQAIDTPEETTSKKKKVQLNIKKQKWSVTYTREKERQYVWQREIAGNIGKTVAEDNLNMWSENIMWENIMAIMDVKTNRAFYAVSQPFKAIYSFL